MELMAASGNNQHVAFALQLIKDGKLDVHPEERFLTEVSLHLKEDSSAVIKEFAVCFSLFTISTTQYLFICPYMCDCLCELCHMHV